MAPVVASYVRVAVGPTASRRLREEESFYRTIDERHRKHFATMDVPLGSVGIAAFQRSEIIDALAPYHSALDLPIVRVLADANPDSLNTVTDAAAP
jgi:hypothetical protein